MLRSRAVSLLSWLGPVIVLFAVTVISYTQGGSFIFSDILKVEQFGAVRLAYYGIGILGVLTVLAGLLLAAVNAAKPGDSPVPLLFSTKEKSEADNPRAVAVVLYQIVLLLAIFGTPIWAIVHANRVLTRGMVWNEALPSIFAVPVQCAMPQIWQKIVKACPESDRLAAGVSFALVGHQVEGSETRLWLSSNRHDIVTAQKMAGDQAGMRADSALSEEERNAFLRVERARRTILASFIDPGFDRLLSRPSSPPLPSASTGPRDRSPPCKAATTGCRGDQWLPYGSPAAVILTTLVGLGLLSPVFSSEDSGSFVTSGRTVPKLDRHCQRRRRLSIVRHARSAPAGFPFQGPARLSAAFSGDNAELAPREIRRVVMLFPIETWRSSRGRRCSLSYG